MKRGLAALAVCVVFALACAKPRPAVPLSAQDPRPASLLDALERDASRRHALRGVAKISLESPNGSGRAKQVLVVERPAHLRVEILGFLNQTVAVLTTDGRRYHLFRAEDRSLSEGEVHPGLLWEVASIALTPEQAVRVLLGVPDLPKEARIEGGALLPEGGVRIELAMPDASTRLLVEFDAEERLRRWAFRDPDGETLWEARFDDYRLVDEAPFAHEIEVRDRLTGSEAHVSFGRIELNPSLPADIFRLSGGGVG